MSRLRCSCNVQCIFTDSIFTGVIIISFDDASPTLAEGAGPLTLCAVLDLPDATMLGCDIEVTFMDLPGTLAGLT